MVSFRFHIVSITAVFLALALGISMGVTVIDKAAVEGLERRLNGVRNDVSAANQRSDELQRQLGRADAYEERADEYLLDERLAGVGVAIVGFKGIEQGPINELERVLTRSGAVLQGTLWITPKAKLDDPKSATTLQQDLEATSSDPAQLRQQLVARLSAVLVGASEGALLKPLLDHGFLEWEGEVTNTFANVPLGPTRLVVAAGAGAGVPNDQVALPLVKALAAAPSRRLVVVESGRDTGAHERALFVGPVRSDSSLTGRLSTVDHLDSPMGRTATVLALAQLPSGRTGNYGYASSAEGPIPKLVS